MSLKQRLERAEQVEAGMGPVPEPLPTAAEWLAWFEGLAAAGYLATEPDHPKALADFRAALAAWQERAPAAAGRPGTLHQPDPNPWPADLRDAFAWFGSMVRRVREGQPWPDTGDVYDLRKWFRAHRDDLQGAKLNGRVTLSDGSSHSLVAFEIGLTLALHDGATNGWPAIVRTLRERFEARQ